MIIISRKEVNEAYEISRKAIEQLIQKTHQKEINPKNYSVVYRHEDLKKAFPKIYEYLKNPIQEQRSINATMWNLYNKFRKHAKGLEFVTDSIVGMFNVDGKERNLYVVDGQIICMFCDRAVPIGEGEHGIFFTRDMNGAKKLYNELETWVAQQDISNF